MTYCVGIKVNEGLLFASDSRTNAGIDQVSKFRKMFIFEKPGERMITLLVSGSLSVTQSVISILRRRVQEEEKKGSLPGGVHSIMTAPSLFDTARLVGSALREVDRVDGASMRRHGASFDATILMGGQIAGEEHRLFQIYSAGNFIEAAEPTCFFQAGETKYGKPILDRLIKPETPLSIAAKCTLVSFDSTMRSNASVGLPIDLLCQRTDMFEAAYKRTLDIDDPYLAIISATWSEGLMSAFDAVPDPDWLESGGLQAAQ